MNKALILFFLTGCLAAQSITNVRARQEGLDMIITYDLDGELNDEEGIRAGYYLEGKENLVDLTGATGDLGLLVTPGKNNTITWHIPEKALVGKAIRFSVFIYTLKDMVFIEGGAFQMGSDQVYIDEKPVHTVTVSSFYMDKTEVTQAEYRGVMGNNPSYFTGCDDCPVENVTWFEATEYAKKVGKRLPTEAEWEYAARGGNQSRGFTYAGSNDLNTVGWNSVNSDGKTHPVAQKQPNELGLYDLSGNVWEWCADWYKKNYYQKSPTLNPSGPASGESRVLRGGSWSFYYGSGCRATDRNRSNPSNRLNYNGFRCARDAN